MKPQDWVYKLPWPSQEEVLREWNDHRPENVRVVELGPEHYGLRHPWWDVENQKLLQQHPTFSRPTSRMESGPTAQTAAHLMRLNDQASDLVAAFKITAFCRYHRLEAMATVVLEPVLQKDGYGQESFWSSRARLLIPPVNTPDVPSAMEPEEQARQCLQLVRAAANAWQQIADRYRVLVVPHLAPPGTKAHRWQMEQLRDALKQGLR